MCEQVTVKDSEYTFLDHQEYMQRVTDEAAVMGPGDRLTLTTMAFDVDPDHPHMVDFMDELTGAASRRADIRLGVDAFAFMISKQDLPVGPLLTGISTERFRRSQAALDRLESAGGQIAVLNKPTSRLAHPWKGKSHIKASVSNSILRLGSCNLNGFGTEDMMVETTNPEASDWVHGTLGSIITAGSVQLALGKSDLRHPIDADSDILIDVGVSGQSLILATAVDIAARSEDWTVAWGQYFQSGKLADQLAKNIAEDRKAVLLYNHSPTLNFNHRLQALLQRRDRKNVPEELLSYGIPAGRDKHFHAKGIATSREAIAGTHDLAERIVNLGTAEIALHVRDEGFARMASRVALGYAGMRESVYLA